MNKLIAFGCLLAALFFMVLADSYGSERHHRTVNNTVNHYPTTIVDNKAVALPIAASQIHVDWSTKKVQLGFGVGSYKDSNALSVGLGKRAGKVLINGSISSDGTNIGYGAGVNLRF